MTSIAQYERAHLSALLEELGPDAPTLCEGWTTRDLAAHLLTRERRGDAALGIVVGPLAGHTESVQQGYARRPYAELVDMLHEKPPRWSIFGWSPVDKLLNSTEFFVHHEDVRRAQPAWEPRDLPPAVQDALWQAVKGRSALTFRDNACGVTLARPNGETHVASKGDPVAVITGEPAELLLYLFGRRDHARVEISGPAEAKEALQQSALDV